MSQPKENHFLRLEGHQSKTRYFTQPIQHLKQETDMSKLVDTMQDRTLSPTSFQKKDEMWEVVKGQCSSVP